MTEPSNNKSNQQPASSNQTSHIENGTNNAKTPLAQPPTTSLFRHFEKNLVLFAYKREIDEDPPQQIMVLQQSKKHYNKDTEQDKIAEMFRNFNLSGTTQKLFLSKIDPLEHKQIAKEIKQMLDVSDSFSRKDRLERRKQIFQSNRPHKFTQQMASEEVLAKRKIRVVKMDSLMQGGSIKGVVQLGGKSFQYEDFNIMNQNQDYYALIRKKVRADEVFPQVSIEENLLSGIDFEQQGIDEEKYQNDDDYDSNDSENSAFDYPEEQDSERSSEGIIRDYDDDEDFDYDRENDEDEEQLYMRYLRRQRRRERQMDEEYEHNYEEYD